MSDIDVKETHRRAVLAAMRLAGEAARLSMQDSNCGRSQMCSDLPCPCATNAVQAGIKAAIEEVMIWNGNMMPDERMEIGDLMASLDEGGR